MVELESCPICSGEIQSGYLASITDLWWYPEQSSQAEIVEYTSLRGARVHGWRCPSCRLVMVEYRDHTFRKAELSGTRCPHCGATYRYSQDMIIDNQIKCQNCTKPFSADFQKNT